jgi:hypothetical protein
MTKRGGGRGRPVRSVTSRSVRPQILVFTEGKRTEPDYIQWWQRLYRERVTVTISPHHGSPMTLVKHAVAARKADFNDARRRRGQSYSDVWCVFDVDEHPQLDNAVRLAGDHGIRVAVSNPCVELWFLLHFQDHRAYLDRHEAQRLAESHLGCKKGLTDEALELLGKSHSTALDRARRLDTTHEGNGTRYPGNPSSCLGELVERLRASGTNGCD